jgi:Flp pilus assembly protein TadG
MFPLFMLIVLGTVDVVTMFAQFAAANKAAYAGARLAIVSDPVATTINKPTFNAAQLNDQCSSAANGASTGECPGTGTAYVCTSSACTPNTYGFSSTAFTAIYNRMSAIYPQLQPANVTVAYQFNGNGYVGQTGGVPMNVTVRIVNMTYNFTFLGGVLGFFGGGWTSVPFPTFASTLTSEDLVTN